MLNRFIEKIRKEYSHLPNSSSALQALNCIAYIQEELTNPDKLDGKGEPRLIQQAVAEVLLRDPDDTSFHVGHLENAQSAKAYFQDLIQQTLGAIEYLSTLSNYESGSVKINYIEFFLQNFRDSDVGCMEMRIKQALDFVALIQSNGGQLQLENLMARFFSQLPDTIDHKNDLAVFLEALNYFHSYVDHLYPVFVNNESKPLSWGMLQHYLREICAFNTALWPNLHASLVTPQKVINRRQRRVDWCLLKFKEEAAAKLYLAFVKSLLPETFQHELNQCRVSQEPGGAFRFRLTINQYAAFTRILEQQPEKDLPAKKVEEDNLFLIKMIRADGNNFFRQFCTMITPSPEHPEKIDLRPGKRKAFTVKADGIFERKTKPPKYSAAQKAGFTHNTSTSIVRDDLRPPPFGFTKQRGTKLVGVYFKLNSDGTPNALLDRLFVYDGGTINRGYDFDTYREAQAYYDKKVLGDPKILFSDLNLFIEELKKKINANKYNEVPARLRWNLDGSCGVCIGSDTFEARMLAMEYARVLRGYLRNQCRELGLPWDAHYQVPIKFYRHEDKEKPLLEDYTLQAQEADITSAKKMLTSFFGKVISLIGGGGHDKFEQDKFEFLLAFENSGLVFKTIFTYEVKGLTIIERILKAKQYHILEFLIEKDHDFAETKKLSERTSIRPLLTPRYCSDVVHNNRVSILDWFRRMGLFINFLRFFFEKQDVSNFRFDDFNMLAYLLSYLDLETQHISKAYPTIKAALDYGHHTFLRTLLQNNFAVSQILMMPLSTQNNPLAYAIANNHLDFIKGLIKANPTFLKVLIAENQYDILRKILPDVQHNIPSELLPELLDEMDRSHQTSYSIGWLDLTKLAFMFDTLVFNHTKMDLKPGDDVRYAEFIMRALAVAYLAKADTQEYHYDFIEAILAKSEFLDNNFTFAFSLLNVSGYHDRTSFLYNKRIITLFLKYKPTELNKLIFSYGNGDCLLNLAIRVLPLNTPDPHNEVFELLLSEPAINVNNPSDFRKSTPLHIACNLGYVIVVERLLKRNDVDINPKNIANRTPLGVALLASQWDIVRLLLRDARTIYQPDQYPSYRAQIDKMIMDDIDEIHNEILNGVSSNSIFKPAHSESRNIAPTQRLQSQSDDLSDTNPKP